MTEQQQVFQFGDELDKLVNRFRQEYDMTYAAIVGTSYMKTHLLCEEANKRGDEV